MAKDLQTELTKKQIYACWALTNESSWRLDNDQVKSAMMNLQAIEGEKIETIPVQSEDGISAIVFGFKGILDDYGSQMEEIVMDSTCENQSTLCSVWSLI